MASFNIILTGSAYLRSKIGQYLNANLPHMRARLRDMSITYSYTSQDKYTSFLLVSSNEAFDTHTEKVLSSIIEEVEAAAVKIDEKFPGEDDGDLEIMYRRQNIRTEIQMILGQTVGYAEYLEIPCH